MTISFLTLEQRAFPESSSCRTWGLWKCVIAVSVHLLYIHQSVENLLLIPWFRYALSEHPATSQQWEQHILLLDQHQDTHQCVYVCWPLTLGKGFLYAFLEDSILKFPDLLLVSLFFHGHLSQWCPIMCFKLWWIKIGITLKK